MNNLLSGQWLSKKLPSPIRSGLCAALFVLAGCASPEAFDGVISLGPEIREINALPIEEARKHVSNKTVMTFDPDYTSCRYIGKYFSCSQYPSHGTQIEYLSESGKAYLWYPGNTRAVRSDWKLEPGRQNKRYHICFKYPSGSVNPVNGNRGGEFRCRNLGEFASGIVDSRSGDIFELSSGRIPSQLSRTRTNFDELLWYKRLQ